MSGGFNNAPLFARPMRRSPLPILLVVLMIGASVQGCFGNEDSRLASADDLDISPEPLTAGIFQSVHFHAEKAMRVFIPYLVLQPDTGYVQNGTILDLGDDEEDEGPPSEEENNRHPLAVRYVHRVTSETDGNANPMIY